MSLTTAFAPRPAAIFIRRCISRPFAASWRTRFDVAPCPSYEEVGNARVLGFSQKHFTYHFSGAVRRCRSNAVQYEIKLTCPRLGAAQTWAASPQKRGRIANGRCRKERRARN